MKCFNIAKNIIIVLSCLPFVSAVFADGSRSLSGERSHFSFEISDQPVATYAIELNESSLYYFGIGYTNISNEAKTSTNTDLLEDTNTNTTAYQLLIGYRNYLQVYKLHEQADYFLDSLKLRMFFDFEYGYGIDNIQECTNACTDYVITTTDISVYYGLQYMLTDYFSIESKIGITYSSLSDDYENVSSTDFLFPKIQLMINYHLDSTQ
jgi:hypothetical protein